MSPATTPPDDESADKQNQRRDSGDKHQQTASHAKGLARVQRMKPIKKGIAAGVGFGVADSGHLSRILVYPDLGFRETPARFAGLAQPNTIDSV